VRNEVPYTTRVKILANLRTSFSTDSESGDSHNLPAQDVPMRKFALGNETITSHETSAVYSGTKVVCCIWLSAISSAGYGSEKLLKSDKTVKQNN